MLAKQSLWPNSSAPQVDLEEYYATLTLRASLVRDAACVWGATNT